MLLDHEAEDVRRYVAVKFVLASSTKKVREVLRRYISSKQSQYYNVNHLVRPWCFDVPERSPKGCQYSLE